MRPQGTRVWRRDGHKARRGISAGRRATHAVETTYGHRQRERDRLAAWQQETARAEMTAATAAREKE